MNYLAHAYLSPNHEAILVGNLMGDWIKGNQKNTLPIHIQHGIDLHHAIDHFTDNHESVLECIEVFKPHFRLSGGIFTDILFDHFLANDPVHFSDESLLKFTHHVYDILNKNEIYLNQRMKQYFGYMQKQNWLYHYKFEEGLRRSIEGICMRYPRLGHGPSVMQHIFLNKDFFHKKYESFFPVLKSQTENFSQKLISLNSHT